jgi:hypothetical protein
VGQGPLYDVIGDTYSSHRQPDPAINRAILEALGAANSVVAVGAGTGSYDPLDDRKSVAVEPSTLMIHQRRAPSAQRPAAIRRCSTPEVLPTEHGAVMELYSVGALNAAH